MAICNDNTVTCLGLMSGTSLDGLDLCLVSFRKTDEIWQYEIIATETVPYRVDFQNKLSQIEHLSTLDFLLFHNEYGVYLGTIVSEFCKKYSIKPEFVASHGHTVFHQPGKGMTFQIGSGASIAAVTGLPVVFDFRVLDVALGGQGAPLVPIGDELLFPQYDFCLNLGGFANISTKVNNVRVAYDICPVNIVLNHYTRKIGKDFDDGGRLAQQSETNKSLCDELNALAFYRLPFPKSLGKEWVTSDVLPLIDNYNVSIPEILHTFCDHITDQIAACLGSNKTVLITGGGAYNHFLISMLKSKTDSKIVIPDDNTIQFKEALIFAFLGLLRMRHEQNCLQSVTGAVRNCVGGSVILG